MASELTPLQEKFLDALFGEAAGDITQARKIAGYASTGKLETMMSENMQDAIVARAKKYLAYNSAKGVLALTGMIDDPTAMGSAVKLKAVTELLDRTNIIKTDRIQVEASGGVFILPAKDKEEEPEG